MRFHKHSDGVFFLVSIVTLRGFFFALRTARQNAYGGVRKQNDTQSTMMDMLCIESIAWKINECVTGA